MKTIKILWVDDMEHWVESAKRNLEIIALKNDVNLIIIHVKNGEEEDLYLKLRNFDSDCIVIDYMMHPFNGDRYVNMIRDDDDYEHLSAVPIIFYSQAPDIDLESLINNLSNVYTVFRGNLEDRITEMFFKKN